MKRKKRTLHLLGFLIPGMLLLSLLLPASLSAHPQDKLYGCWELRDTRVYCTLDEVWEDEPERVKFSATPASLHVSLPEASLFGRRTCLQGFQPDL